MSTSAVSSVCVVVMVVPTPPLEETHRSLSSMCREETPMTSEADQSLEVLSRAVDQADQVLSAVTTQQLSDPTPCPGWDVRRLMAHLVAAPGNFVLMSTGRQPDWSAQPPLPDDWTAEFRSETAGLMRMWHEAGDSA